MTGALVIILLSITLNFIPFASAHCPLCTGATIIGVGITRAWGLDDSVIGVFVGGMIASSALWIDNVLQKRGAKGNRVIRMSALLIITLILTLVSFYYAGIVGRANQYRTWGVESILIGTFSGIAITFFTLGLSGFMKKKNEGKVWFSYQTMILTLGGLVLNALAFWIVFR